MCADHPEEKVCLVTCLPVRSPFQIWVCSLSQVLTYCSFVCYPQLCTVFLSGKKISICPKLPVQLGLKCRHVSRMMISICLNPKITLYYERMTVLIVVSLPDIYKSFVSVTCQNRRVIGMHHFNKAHHQVLFSFLFIRYFNGNPKVKRKIYNFLFKNKLTHLFLHLLKCLYASAPAVEIFLNFQYSDGVHFMLTLMH